MAPLLWNDEQLDRTKEDSPDAALMFFREEEWEKVRTWSTSSTRLRIGPATLDFEIANRLMDKSEWDDSLEIDAAMYVFWERTSLKRWRPHRVAFMTVVFSNMIKKETEDIWNVDVDRLYVHVHVSGNHWIALCINFVTRSIDVFDCLGRKRYKELDGFANLIPRIVKAVQPTRHQKDFAFGAYTVSYVPVGKLKKSACDCGVYAVKFIECHALGLELSLLHDGNIIEACHIVLWDLWEVANDLELIERMSKYQSPECLSSTVEEIPTEEIWNVDVDRLYVPVHVSGNHWIALCISFVTRSIDVFDCSGRKRYKELDGFANLIPRIVKAVQPTRHQKDFAIGAYTVSYVPVGRLNKSTCDCGVYAVMFIECHALGLELSLLHDGNIIEARHRVLWDLWKAANDPELIERMSKYQSPECLSSTLEEIL
ncbi:hypothetical protein F2Q69_00027804 [Brassica cretica]|uniref:Ubiquitin-like protease family profile domain-containing protein n=1 Tax=Brassica cretica TaxID=69181 RepID=A0A8S9RVB6_BRACR|nr:hypothetical protein F2Q69_00027804 [Brassica cretica]